ncbi:hypothetical protein GCM10022226_06190 [Sphaerisporangium flaviroseum]|uniref:Uncharacterized protein n=1 Tax=Sphaerisporangium flaviroseum TaxID=509199 RepID=A0ABP7HD97_9ACTN
MVDLPAPFSPAKATTSPFETANDTSFTATTPPNDFDSPLTEIAATGLTMLGSQPPA